MAAGHARRRGAAVESLLSPLCATARDGGTATTLLVVAHPDDEAVSAGALLPRLGRPLIVLVTDGAPRDLADARAAGFDTRTAYAACRRAELRRAMHLAGIPAAQLAMLGRVDQEASSDLAGLARAVHARIAAAAPAVVLTHPYEGGHPDHDAAAFAVHLACALLRRDGARPPAVLEFTSYHGRGGALVVGRFLRVRSTPVVTHVLDAGARERKAALLRCYPSQARVLAQFPRDREQYRLAPAYDFTRPPHRGPLYYEQFPWGVTGPEWRRRAALALRILGGGDAPLPMSGDAPRPARGRGSARCTGVAVPRDAPPRVR